MRVTLLLTTNSNTENYLTFCALQQQLVALDNQQGAASPRLITGGECEDNHALGVLNL